MIALKVARDSNTSLNPVNLYGIINVISFPSCKKIIGSGKENLLMAVGGETTIDAKDGDDTLVSTRGRHELIGGPGADTFVLHGPDVKDFLTISILKENDGNTIRCKTTIYGEWIEAEGRLYIDLLRHDHADVLLKTVDIIPAQGDEGKNLGTISKDTANRKIIFEPGSNFNFLEKNKAKTIRITYTTTGSMASIKEQDYGNELRFESIKSLSHLSASIANDNLVFMEKSNPPQTVLIDHEWSNKFKTGWTSVSDLIIDFVQRFPSILFRENERQFNRATPKDITEFLSKQLEHIVTDLGRDYDTVLDSACLPRNVGDEIYVGNGQNIVVAKTKGKTYTIGSKSSGSIIVANNFTEGFGDVTIRGGEDPSSHNTVVVGVDSDTAVEIRTGPHDLIITGALMSEVDIYRDDEGMLRLRNDRQRDLIKGWNWGKCEKLIFKKWLIEVLNKVDLFPEHLNKPPVEHRSVKEHSTTQIIFDCRFYVNSKLRNQPPSKWIDPITVSYDSDKLLKLNYPFKEKDTIINVRYEDKEKSFWVYLTHQNRHRYPPGYTLMTRYPYLVVPADRKEELDLKVLVNAIRFQFKGGIKFFDRLVEAGEICEFVVEKANNNKVSLYGYDRLTNRHFECNFI